MHHLEGRLDNSKADTLAVGPHFISQIYRGTPNILKEWRLKAHPQNQHEPMRGCTYGETRT